MGDDRNNVVRWVAVSALATVAVLVALGAVVLPGLNRPGPDEAIVNLGFTALGALAGVLVDQVFGNRS